MSPCPSAPRAPQRGLLAVVDADVAVLAGEHLAEAVRLGEVGLDDELGTHLDLGSSPAASVTLVQLATHHSGLPSHPEYEAAVLDGPLSNSAALEPTGEFGDSQRVQLGYLWEITPMRDRTLTGHEGRTFGFSSLLQIDREAGTAVVALVNRSDRIHGIVLQLFALMATLRP